MLAGLAGAGCVPPEDGEKVGVTRQAQSVDSAASSSCSTTAVEGLSLQIVAQANCLNLGKVRAALPTPSNVSFGASVFAFMEQPARDAGIAVAWADETHTDRVNSVL